MSEPLSRDDLRKLTAPFEFGDVTDADLAAMGLVQIWEDCGSHTHGHPGDVNLACEHCDGTGKRLRDGVERRWECNDYRCSGWTYLIPAEMVEGGTDAE